MSWFARIVNVLRAGKLGQELDEELNFHLAERVDELVAGGMARDEARLEALRRFGNVTVHKERTRDVNVERILDLAVSDLRYAIRQLRLAPGFAAVAVLSLALGIGANTAIFQLIDALRLRSLPVQDPWELAAIDTAPDFYTSGNYRSRNRAFTYAQFEQLRMHQQAFSDVLAFGDIRFNLSRGGEARFAEGLFVSANYFKVLGVMPLLGRDFAATNDDRDCRDAGAILSYSFWQREFGGDGAVLGRTIQLNGQSFPVIGVAPKEFFGLEPGRRFDVAVPLCVDTLMADDGRGRMDIRHAWWLTLVGRLKPGWSVERASAHITQLSEVIFRETVPEVYRPDDVKAYLANKLRVVAAGTGISSLRRQYENPLWMLLVTTALVLLIACANLANLLLARASAREREIAIRQSLGASRTRLVSQLLSESFLLAALGGVLGALLAQLLSRALVAFLDSGSDPVFLNLDVNWRVFGFASVLSLLTCLLFGLTPAIRATGIAPANAMRGGRGTTTNAERNGLRRMLVVSQIALSLVLLVSALLFGRSLRNLLTAEAGLNADGVLLTRIDTTPPKLQPERRRQVFQQIEERTRSLPGAVSVGSAWLTPFGNSSWNQNVRAEGGVGTSAKKLVWMNLVGPGYFDTMQISLLAGRDFDSHDDRSAPKVAIVNEAFAKEVFNGENPVGRTFRAEEYAGKQDSLFQIVGLVRNTKYFGLRDEFRPFAYFPLNQAEEMPAAITIAARTHGPVNDVMAVVRRAVAEINP